VSDGSRVAFVLAGAASLGAVEVGMLLVATSAGALNAAFIASRPQTVQTADALGEIWRGLHRGQVFPINLVTGLLGFSAGTRAR